MLNFNHIYYFHVVALEGSIVRAATRLGVTQPTVSEQVRQLERTLEVQLFDRAASGLKLTEAGRVAFAQTSVMFQASDRMLGLLGKTPPPLAPGLRVGVTTGVAQIVAARFLVPLLTIDEYASTITTGDFVDMLGALRTLQLDILLVDHKPTIDAADGLRVSEVGATTIVAIAAPALLDKGGKVNWSKVSIIQYRPISPHRGEVADFLQAKGVTPAVRAEADDAQLMLEAAIRGTCVAFVSENVAADAIAAGRVKVIEKLPAGGAKVHALYRDDTASKITLRAVEMLTHANH